MTIDHLPVLTEIRRRLERLSEGQQRIGRFVLDQPERAKAISLKALCRECQTSEPVVFAFCSALGIDGYRAFKTALAEDLGARRLHSAVRASTPIVDADLHESESAAEFFSNLTQMYRQALDESLAGFDPAVFAAAVDALEGAGRIAIVGVGVSGNVGFVALQNFLRTGTPVTWTNDPNLNFTHLAPLKPGDVCLALSQMGNQADTVQAAAFARARGVTVIAISSDPESPLADYADHLLLTAPSGISTASHLSIGAQIALPVLLMTDALAVAVGARRRDDVEERSAATHEAMRPRTLERRNRRA